MKTYMLQSNDGSKSLGGSSLGAGIQYFSVGPMHSYLKNLKAVDYTFATDKEILDAYKLIAKTEGISAALELKGVHRYSLPSFSTCSLNSFSSSGVSEHSSIISYIFIL